MRSAPTDPKVTVVVPVYNPGSDLDPCVASLLAQTLPAGELELVFVDDGSTDGTGARLDELAAAHAHVRVIHQPNSGWPGKPRNVGADAAAGAYVHFVDQDDSLGAEALERLWKFGTENDADIVIGKVTSDFRPVPHHIWRQNVPRCSIRGFPLIESLTPHKMFRRSFLREHDLRYPEGKRRLEDQLFMVEAYFATDAVAILADYPCYFYKARQEGANSGAESIDPAGYYTNLREVLDVVDRHTAPGPERDALLRRFLHAIDRRVSGVAGDPSMQDTYVEALFAQARAVVQERFPETAVGGVATLRRNRLRALEADRLDLLRQLAAAASDVRARGRLTDIRWTGASWQLQIEAGLCLVDGSPLVLLPDGNRWAIDERFAPSELDIRSDTKAEILDAAVATVSIKGRRNAVEWLLAGQLEARLSPAADSSGARTVSFSGAIVLDPAAAACGSRADPGRWDVTVRVRALGITRVARIAAPPELGEPDPALLRPEPLLVQPQRTAKGRLAVAVDQVRKLGPVIREHLGEPALQGDRVVAPVDLRLVGGKSALAAAATIEWATEPPVVAEAELRRTDDGATLSVVLPPRARRHKGSAQVLVRVGGKGAPTPLCTIRFDALRRPKEITEKP